MTFRRNPNLRLAYERFAVNLEYRLVGLQPLSQLQGMCGRRGCEGTALLPEKAKGTEWWCCADCMRKDSIDAKLWALLQRDETITPDEAREAMHNAVALIAARSQRGRA